MFKYLSIDCSSGCVDWRWTYQYSYPPTIEDLYTHTPYFDTQFLSPKEPNPVSAHVQLSYVLPRRQLNLLPEEIRTKLLSEMGESYPDECEIMWAYCRYIWEAHAEFLCWISTDCATLYRSVDRLIG